MTRRPGGWRKGHPDAVIVARPSKWGNPYRPVRTTDGQWAIFDDNGMDYSLVGWGPYPDRLDAIAQCVEGFRVYEVAYRDDVPGLTEGMVRRELAGKDLACWCPLDQPCHADVLLELANGGA